MGRGLRCEREAGGGPAPPTRASRLLGGRVAGAEARPEPCCCCGPSSSSHSSSSLLEDSSPGGLTVMPRKNVRAKRRDRAVACCGRAEADDAAAPSALADDSHPLCVCPPRLPWEARDAAQGGLPSPAMPSPPRAPLPGISAPEDRANAFDAPCALGWTRGAWGPCPLGPRVTVDSLRPCLPRPSAPPL